MANLRASHIAWRSLSMWVVFLAILVMLPQARVLLATGFLGGLVIGVLLILARHQSGPRWGTPITLFPRSVTLVSYESRA